MKIGVAVTALIVITLGVAIDGCKCKLVQFIFGDSLVDVGNNGYLSKSLAQASLPWYGIDFGTGYPNGRFTNGRTVADIMGDQAGLPRPPAFLDPSLTEDMILENGVNYASGGGGILNDTGNYFIQRLSFDRQLELHKGTQELIIKQIGQEAAQKFFREAKYVVAIGSNDFINNYLMPTYNAYWTYNDQSFIEYLMEHLGRQLQVLHSLGARDLVVFGLGPMGCIPLQRVLSSSGECQDRTNKLALRFNQAATKLLHSLSSTLPNASFKFGDGYDLFSDLISHPYKYGFNNSDSPCCSFGRIRPALTCIPSSKLCKDRSKYVFWDEYHPSEKANELIASVHVKKFGLLKPPSPASTGAPSP